MIIYVVALSVLMTDPSGVDRQANMQSDAFRTIEACEIESKRIIDDVTWMDRLEAEGFKVWNVQSRCVPVKADVA